MLLTILATFINRLEITWATWLLECPECGLATTGRGDYDPPYYCPICREKMDTVSLEK